MRLDAVTLPALPFPGETTNLTLTGSQLRELAAQSTRNSPARALLYLPASGNNDVRAGALLAVSSAKHGDEGFSVCASAVCRARPGDGGIGYRRVHDWVVWEYAARKALADALVAVSNLAAETRELRVRLGEEDVAAWARCRAMAADELDSSVQESEWVVTPPVLRETYSRRAELFSFSAIRYAVADTLEHAALGAVWDCTCTLERVQRAHELLVKAKAEAAAKLSLQTAFGNG